MLVTPAQLTMFVDDMPTGGIDMSELDPRPDLEGDHAIWEGILGLAKTEFPVWFRLPNGRRTTIYHMLDGLRCGGAGLTWRPNGLPKLDYRPLIEAPGSEWDDATLLNEWLNPIRDRLSGVFRRARELALKGEVQ